MAITRTSLQSLPDELLLQIFGDPQITKTDLRNLRKCSLRFCSVSNTLLFENVIIKIPIHHGGSCSRAAPKYRSHKSPISSYPEPTLTRTKYLKIEFEKFTCMLCTFDQRVCRKIFKTQLLQRPKELKELNITVDWWSPAALPVISLTHEGLRNVSDGKVNLEWKNLNIPKMDDTFLRILTTLPHQTLRSFKISFYGGVRRYSNLGSVHQAMGKLLKEAEHLRHLSLYHVSSPGNVANLEIDMILSSIDSDHVLSLESLELARADLSLLRDNARKIRNLRKLSTVRASCIGLLKGLYDAGIKLSSISVDDMSDALFSYLSFAKSTLESFEIRQSGDWYPRPPDRDPALCPRFWTTTYPEIKDSLTHLKILGCRNGDDLQTSSLVAHDVDPLLTCLPNPTLTILPSKSLESLAICIHPAQGYYKVFQHFLRQSPSLRNLQLCMHAIGKNYRRHTCYHRFKYKSKDKEKDFKRMLSKTAPASLNLTVQLIGCDDDYYGLFGSSWDWKTTYVWNGRKWRETD